jgi:hypothetical protein
LSYFLDFSSDRNKTNFALVLNFNANEVKKAKCAATFSCLTTTKIAQYPDVITIFFLEKKKKKLKILYPLKFNGRLKVFTLGRTIQFYKM